MDLLRWLARWIPEDPNPTGGFWIFRLPESAQWMNAVFRYHDNLYIEGPKLDPPMQLADIDDRIFVALITLARTDPSPHRRCRKYRQAFFYWRLMRVAGRYLYRRHSA